MGFYTLILIGGLFYYEEKIARLNRELNANNDMFDKIYELDKDNKLLQNQIKALKAENAELRATAGDWQRAYQLNKPIQYNYSYWQPDNNVTSWTTNMPVGTTVISSNVEDSYEEFVQDILDLEQ
jgi:hypothetical protein